MSYFVEHDNERPEKHTQEHTHTHSHEHTHEHGHDHEDGPMTMEKVKALLGYMVSHNDHHAEEMADLLDHLPEASREKLLKAIGTFEAANVELKEVLDTLE